MNKKYENFEDTLAQCLGELRRGLKKLGFENKDSLSDYEFACVAIAYNTGRFVESKNLKQGYFNGIRYYGEEVYRFVRLSRTVGRPEGIGTLGRSIVMARGGLNLRRGPGLAFGITKTIETGTEVTVVGLDGPDAEWARVDLEGDGLVDGYVFASFLKAAEGHEPNEEVEEPA